MRANFILLLCAALLSGCAAKYAVVANTSTVIGLEVNQNPATHAYAAKMGYVRSETAVVPTGRGTPDGAKASADVLMELRYGRMFSLTDAALYQRLAVGSEAVKQPGATIMFAKSPDGTLDPVTAAAITRAKTVPEPDPEATSLLLPMAKAWQAAPDKRAFDAEAQAAGHASFADFLTSPKVTPEVARDMFNTLKIRKLIP